MALHHFADADVMLGEVRRVLRPGGLLLLRDHDCSSEGARLFYDAVHALYACVLGEEETPEAFAQRYAARPFAHYRSQEAWLQSLRPPRRTA